MNSVHPELEAARARRTEILWQRFAVLTGADPQALKAIAAEQRPQYMRRHLNAQSRDSLVRSALEAADLGCSDFTAARPAAAPTAAPPGTPQKLAVLSARAAAGKELWHTGDADGYDG